MESAPHPEGVSIHPPLCRRGEPGTGFTTPFVREFQSTPRFVGEGNATRGQSRRRATRFNPPPALSARGTRRRNRPRQPGAVSIHPPLCRRGERRCGELGQANEVVSIHPPLCRRGEQAAVPSTSTSMRFNPPPALSARGTRDGGSCLCRLAVSIHPPLCRRGERHCPDTADDA